MRGTVLRFISMALVLALGIASPASAQLKEPSAEIKKNIDRLDDWLAKLPAAKRPSDSELLKAVAWENARRAIQFLKDQGETTAAATLKKDYLEGGWLYGDAKAEGETESFTNAISIRNKTLNPRSDSESAEAYKKTYGKKLNGPSRYSPLDPEQDVGELADLAATLFHEWVHTTQYTVYRKWMGGRAVVGNGDLAEKEAWDRTIELLHQWASKAFTAQASEKDPARRKILAVRAKTLFYTLRASVHTYYSENSSYWPAYNLRHLDSPRTDLKKQWREFEKQLDIIIKYLSKLVDPPGDSETPESSETSQLPRLLKTPASTNDSLVPRQGELAMHIRGLGKASGHSLDLEISNVSDHMIVWDVPIGLVLQPGNPGVQRMMTGQESHTEVPPHSNVTVPVIGFCLDPDRDPPPAGGRGPLGILTNSLQSGTPQLDMPWGIDPAPEWAGLAEVIRAGNELSEKGDYREIFPHEKHRETVIQRALWYERTRGTPNEMGRERLQRDLQEQFKEAGKNPPPEEVKKGGDSIWNDVDLTLKKARASKT